MIRCVILIAKSKIKMKNLKSANTTRPKSRNEIALVTRYCHTKRNHFDYNGIGTNSFLKIE